MCACVHGVCGGIRERGRFERRGKGNRYAVS